MVCINSIIVDQDLLKILNIILNSSTGLILSLISNFKFYEHIQQYHQLQIKFNKLCHLIDSKMTNDLESINNDFISNVVEDYDQICEIYILTWDIPQENIHLRTWSPKILLQHCTFTLAMNNKQWTMNNKDNNSKTKFWNGSNDKTKHYIVTCNKTILFTKQYFFVIVQKILSTTTKNIVNNIKSALLILQQYLMTILVK